MSENSEDVIIRKLSLQENQKLFEVLARIKESLSTAVVQLLFASNPDPVPVWQNVVTGVACLSQHGDSNKYIIEVNILLLTSFIPTQF